MARARNIKPGFFKNEVLVALPFEVRLLFVGLWTLADREGRLEDRPVRIKMEVFPADAVDVDGGLSFLARDGFIERYEVEGRRYIQILAWQKHQNPHPREAQSEIPASSHPRPCQGNALDMPSNASSLIPSSLIPDSEPNGSGADAPAANDQPPADPLWGTGLAFLMRKGIPEKPARSLLGRLKHSLGDGEAARIVSEAEAQDITDPAPWLLKAMGNAKARAGPGKDRPSIAQQFGQKTYTGTPDDELPSFLRDNAA